MGDKGDIKKHWADQYNHYNELLSKYKGGELALTRDEANTLGLTGKSGQGIYDLLAGKPASNYLDLEGYDVNKVISKDQFAQLAALDKLANAP